MSGRQVHTTLTIISNSVLYIHVNFNITIFTIFILKYITTFYA